MSTDFTHAARASGGMPEAQARRETFPLLLHQPFCGINCSQPVLAGSSAICKQCGHAGQGEPSRRLIFLSSAFKYWGI